MTIGIIGGTGLTSLKDLEIRHREMVHTPYGEPSSPVTHGVYHGKNVLFLPRHGSGHNIPPHRINYRANIWALRHLEVQCIVAVAAVGGIEEDMPPGKIAFPDQIIDYTWGRASTFFDQDLTHVTHIDFSFPYDNHVREALIAGAGKAGIDALTSGVYGATQGPRLETAAEIRRMRQDGCTMVGMTGMPEAALAREMNMAYATCAVSANWAAGINDHPISLEEIRETLDKGMSDVRHLLSHVVPLL